MRTILTPELQRVSADVEIPLQEVTAKTTFEQGAELIREGETVKAPKSLADKWKAIGYAE